MAVTLRDVAQDVGVSIKTVSRVVNGDTNVADCTADRVWEAVQRLGYRPNFAARALRTGTDATIGLVVDSVADPFFASLLGAAEEILDERGFALLSASGKRDLARQDKVLTNLVQRSVSGCLVAPAADDMPAPHFDVPLVYFDRMPQGTSKDAVIVEDYQASKRAVAYLIERGHRRIAFLGDEPVIRTTSERLRGYRDALAEAGIAEQVCLISLDGADTASSVNCTLELLDLPEPPTAIFTAGGRQALGVVSACTPEQRQQIALISFGDFPAADALQPAVTVVDHNPTTLVSAAIDLLLHRIDNPGAPQTVRTLSLNLIARGSGEIRPT